MGYPCHWKCRLLEHGWRARKCWFWVHSDSGSYSDYNLLSPFCSFSTGSSKMWKSRNRAKRRRKKRSDKRLQSSSSERWVKRKMFFVHELKNKLIQFDQFLLTCSENLKLNQSGDEVQRKSCCSPYKDNLDGAHTWWSHRVIWLDNSEWVIWPILYHLSTLVHLLNCRLSDEPPDSDADAGSRTRNLPCDPSWIPGPWNWDGTTMK